MDETPNTEVIESPIPALEAPVSTDAGNAPVAEQGESAPQTAGQAPTTDDKAGQAEAAFQVPENDDDLKGKENDPHVQAIIQMRGELRARDKSIDEYKPLENWKELASTIGDPVLAKSSYELVSSIHTPNAENPSGFSAKPFLEKLETDSPGTVDQLFADTLTLTVPDQTGKPSTVVRELVKSWGLDPDRIDDYRNIDKLRASGIVSAEDLGKVPEKYHAAFKSLSSGAREDILSMQETNPAAMEEYLRNAHDALEARTWREKDEQSKADAQRAADTKFQSDLAVSIEQDIFSEVRTIHDSIHQNLASQLKFAGDETANNLEYAKIMSTLATLQNPAYRFVAENALKSVGVELNGFDELANRWEERRSAYKTFDAMSDKWQANRALSEATIAKQQLLARLSDYALRLGKASGERAAAASAQMNDQVGAATARFVPSGNGQLQQGATNPYANNPHPVGSQEYYAWYRNIDKANNLTNASVFGG